MRHADPRAQEHRFTIGRVLALAWRAWLACRWPIILIGVPTAVADVGIRWLVYRDFGERIPADWREMIFIWLDVPVDGIAFVAITFAALSHAGDRTTSARDAFRIPWRRVSAALVASFILQTATYWPMPLLSWPVDSIPLLLVDYAILAINVLTFDVLTFVWLPVLLTEELSLIATFRRSVRFAMTHPWRLLAIDIGLWALYFAFGEAVTAAVTVTYVQLDPQYADLAWNAMTALWIIVMLSLGCCLIVAAYHMIRSEHEGPAPDAVAVVFD